MITEDYVSFEVAKLLKEKGFNEYCMYFYRNPYEGYLGRKDRFEFNQNSDHKDEEWYACPTLHVVMKWLREMHNLHIDVDPSEGNWNPTVLELEDWTCAVKFGDNIPIQDSYEKACKEAIKYCLKNLI